MSKYKMLLIVFVFLFPIRVLADGADSTIVMDVDSGRVLYEKNSHSKNLIASTTKIMTCIIVLENSSLDDEITVGEEVLDMVGTNIYISVGEKIKIKDLLYGLILRSGNDAAQTLAYNTLGYNQFVEAMNNKARELDMKDTTFSNPHGLDDDTMNYSTAYDMALLSKYAYKNKIYREIISTKKYSTKSSIKSYVWYNRMSLLTQYKKCIGGKNGYTPKAGKSLVSYANDKNLTLTIVTLDDPDIYVNHKSLYEKYFSRYSNYKIIDNNNFYIPSNFYDGKLYLKESFSYPLKSDEIEKVSTLVKIFSNTQNNVMGKVEIKLNDNKIGEVNVYRKKQNKKEDLTIFQKIKNFFNKLIIR